MHNNARYARRLCFLAVIGLFILLPLRTAFSHCDGMDGPVVEASRKALDTGDLSGVLIWVPEQSEAEIRDLFDKVLAVRRLENPDAKAIAEKHFFETVVRVHRAFEGAPFTGLKPAGRDLGPAIPAADKAIEQGSLDEVGGILGAAVQKGLEARFEAVMHSKNFDKKDAEAGRKYVEAYVRYIHYVEKIHEAASAPVDGHFHENHAE